MRLTESDVDKLHDEHGMEGEEILYLYLPTKIDKKIQRAVKLLNEALKETLKVFPDANYYLSATALHLMLGSSHAGEGQRSQYHRVATTDRIDRAGGGDW